MIKKKVETTLTGPFLKALDHLVEKGIFMSYQDVIRDALIHIFRHYGIEPFSEFVEEPEKSSV